MGFRARRKTLSWPRPWSGSWVSMLPRYHGSYESLRKRNGEVIAVPKKQSEPTPNIDEPPDPDFPLPNTSILNPLAAAIVQYRVVRAALKSRN